MNQLSLAWSAQYRDVVVALATFTGGYFLYWFIANSARLRRFCDKRYAGERAQAMYILFQRIVGIVFLGIPVILVTIILPAFGFTDFGVRGIDSPATLFWILGQRVSKPFGLTFNRAEPPCWKGSCSVTLFWLELYIGWQANEDDTTDGENDPDSGNALW